MINVVDISDTSINDVFQVCSGNHLDDPVLQKGIQLKQAWIKENLAKYGSFTKIAYYEGEPAAQILFYPEVAIPYYREPRPRVIEIFCAYRAMEEAKGAGTLLLKNLIEEAKTGIRCLDGEPADFLVASPFNTGEGTSLRKYYMDNGFRMAEDELYLELNNKYYPRTRETYENPDDDLGKAIILYDMNCEYGWFFAVNIERILKEMDDSLEIVKINKWLNPDESVKRGNASVIVNGKTISSYWRSPEFRVEVKDALKH